MIHIQHGSLGAFRQNTLAGVEGFVEEVLGIDELELAQFFGCCEPLCLHAFEVVLEVGVLGKEAEGLGAQRLVALLELTAGEVTDTEAVATGLVHVGRTDAFQGRADFGLAFRLFRCCVEQAVSGGDEVGTAAGAMVAALRGHGDLQQALKFLEQAAAEAAGAQGKENSA